LIVTSSRQLLFLIPCLLIIPRIFGLNGLWAAYPVADTLAIILALIWTGIEFRELGLPINLRSFLNTEATATELKPVSVKENSADDRESGN
jgi:hypothetical protein